MRGMEYKIENNSLVTYRGTARYVFSFYSNTKMSDEEKIEIADTIFQDRYLLAKKFDWVGDFYYVVNYYEETNEYMITVRKMGIKQTIFKKKY